MPRVVGVVAWHWPAAPAGRPLLHMVSHCKYYCTDSTGAQSRCVFDFVFTPHTSSHAPLPWRKKGEAAATHDDEWTRCRPLQGAHASPSLDSA